MELKFSQDDIFSYAVADQVGIDDAKKRIDAGEVLHVKLGIDPTSANIHIGRAIVLWRLRAFQELGHKIELIIGDFTGQVGDTSDKDSERPMLSEEQVTENMARYEEQLWMVLNPERKDQVTFHHNSTWLNSLSLGKISHLADAFSVNTFIKRELVAKRLEKGGRVSLREMLYPLMQGYDSIAVEADVELGGTDQWFNLLAGRTLQEQAGKRQQAIIVNPLVSGMDGRKMSSSYGNGIFLLDTPKDKFGKFMTLRDDLMADFLIVFPQPALPFTKEELATRIASGENPRDIKLDMSERLVALYHGEDVAKTTRQEYMNQFSEKQLPTDIPELHVEGSEISIVDLLIVSTFAKSKTEARQLVREGAVKFNNEKVTDTEAVVAIESGSLLQVGPRRYVKLI